MGVFTKVFAGFNHSFALLDQNKVKRNRIEAFDDIPAPEFKNEKKLTSQRSIHSQSMKDLNEADDLVPKDTIGWILEYEKDEDLRDDIKVEHITPGGDAENHPLSQQDLTRYSLPANFTPFYLQVNYTDT